MTANILHTGHESPSDTLIAAGGLYAGTLTPGNYTYGVSYVTSFGESDIEHTSTTTTVTGSVILQLPVSTNPNVLTKNLYRGDDALSLLQIKSFDADVTAYTDFGDLDNDTSPPKYNDANSVEHTESHVRTLRPESLSFVTGLVPTNAPPYQLATSEVNFVLPCYTPDSYILLPKIETRNVGMRIYIVYSGVDLLAEPIRGLYNDYSLYTKRINPGLTAELIAMPDFTWMDSCKSSNIF